MAIYITIESFHGSNIHDVAEEAVGLSDRLNIPLKFVFDGIELFVYPGHSVQREDRAIDLVTEYQSRKAIVPEVIQNPAEILESITKW